MLTKSAVNRARALLRAGKLSPKGIKKLINYGALPNPKQYAEGLKRGNIGIARNYGLIKFDPEGNVVGGKGLYNKLIRDDRILQGIRTNVTHGTADVVPMGLQGGVMSNPLVFTPTFGYTNTTKGPPGFFRSIRAGYRAAVNKGNPTPRNQRLSMTSYADQSALADRKLKALADRHELDEYRALSALRKHNPAAEGDATMRAFGHIAPSVLINEARNAQGLGPEAVKRIRNLRSRSTPSLMWKMQQRVNPSMNPAIDPRMGTFNFNEYKYLQDHPGMPENMRPASLVRRVLGW